MNNARKFLEKGNKVKVTLRFRGREMAHMSKTKYILDDFAEKLADIAAVDKPAKVEGRSITAVPFCENARYKDITIIKRTTPVPKMKTSRAAA